MQISHAPTLLRARGPFGAVTLSVGVALLYAAAAATWAAAGAVLPGGRWLVVHLFTLGVLTNLVVGFSQHFGRTLTRAAGDDPVWPTALLNAGIVVLLTGITTGAAAATAIGGSTVTAVVFERYLTLRRLRRAAVGARFGWIVRCYERAHGSFVHGAILGLLMGLGLVSGSWYGAARVAHLHVNVLGWAGLTLLATLVFFGPTVVRRQIAEGADARAATTLRWGATGLTAGVLLLLASGIGDETGGFLRVSAAGCLAVYATAAVVVLRPVAAVARDSQVEATRWSVLALCTWFQLVVWADVLVVAGGSWRYLDALGLAIGVGVVLQAIVVTLSHVAPLLIARRHAARIRLALDRGARTRAVLHNVGTLVLVAAAVDLVGGPMTNIGWVLVATAVAQPVLGSLLSSARDD